MTVGQKIQKSRKQLNMSQEELGQKLLVSRQTISLWEKDQTLPTIDNLLRLREIFQITVDEILGKDCTENAPEMLPQETYQFSFTQKEINDIYRQDRSVFIKRIFWIVLGFGFFILFLAGTEAPHFLIGISFGALIGRVILSIKGLLARSKMWIKTADRIDNSSYEYLFFEDHFCVDLFCGNEVVRRSICYYADIDQIRQLDQSLLLEFGGQFYILRKNDLQPDSVIFSWIRENPKKVKKTSRFNLWNVVAVVLFVASFFSIFLAMELVSIVSADNYLSFGNMWLFFLCTPIPLASVVFGFVLKAKGYAYKKNVIGGLIVTGVLCIYGCFFLIDAHIYDHSDAPIIRIEQIVGIDIPDHKAINTQDWTNSVQLASREHVYSSSDVYFDIAEAEKLEKQIMEDDRWLSALPSDLIGISSTLSDYSSYDYILIYNTETSEYNSLPQDRGTFRFISIQYSTENHKMEFAEYEVDYIQ